jgi:hypothetical protein
VCLTTRMATSYRALLARYDGLDEFERVWLDQAAMDNQVNKAELGARVGI